ncbi:MAG: formate--tetrahydrofolate ligase [Gammaproteobacteria bacterium]|jgi:formate--tetrahydrofolate ligase|nr:formate--tetrahydrofolate ligase [Gammaproteobacteria bacterium]MBT3868822.1 formate--tetrahydrofolate ligase [Gammaproteobacteria bacterium]MBT4618539.1 formate--tetrahydrofolate ligase [Gammaproteobacteria bacterium]MBT5199409.1 formate--tetrahydrofolate ligase [Gammaproteobacteria bacterium]MBT5442552.1 formate--tetrahydrofolate ligase [Gammaproteobacteria bacterium]
MNFRPENKAREPGRNDQLPTGTPDIQIARSVAPQSILLLAQQRLGLPAESLIPFGHFKAKVDLSNIDTGTAHGKLVLVTAITPTPAGEGKTTTSVGLNDALNLLGKNSMVCLREPSLGPCFGMKGGAAGGGWAQVIPMEDINLHFNGDFHAITSAHNLLTAMIDNHLHWGNEENIDPRKITWKRVVDLNDRALRHVVQGLGGSAHGIPRESGFDITVASEIMAIICLAENLKDLQVRLGKIVIGRRYDKTVVTASDVGADGALTVLLKDAFLPNLVQSLEHNPVFIHGGPFANIAHGCNSVAATRAALSLSEIVITEAGFGADLGAEKFINIKCRQSGLRPDAVVLVCTIRALKMQGGVTKSDLVTPNTEALLKGATNLEQHVRNLRQFGLTPIISINRFPFDTEEELRALLDICDQLDVKAAVADHWAKGGEGAKEVARLLVEQLADSSAEVQMLYDDEDSLIEKIETIATTIYGASGVELFPEAKRQLAEFEALGFGHLPVCIAKTQYSFTADPKQTGELSEHTLPVREARLAAGAGFIVVVCGDVMTMPGLPRHPAALDIGLDENGLVEGLF